MLKHKNVNAKKIPKEAIAHMKKNTDMDIVYSCLCSLCRSIGALPPEKRIMGGVNMPSLQTKVLVATPISGDNFRIIPPNCMVG